MITSQFMWCCRMLVSVFWPNIKITVILDANYILIYVHAKPKNMWSLNLVQQWYIIHTNPFKIITQRLFSIYTSRLSKYLRITSRNIHKTEIRNISTNQPSILKAVSFGRLCVNIFKLLSALLNVLLPPVWPAANLFHVFYPLPGCYFISVM